MDKNNILAGVAGGVVGFIAALLLAPKSGSALINDLSTSLQKSVRKIKSHNHSQKKGGRKIKRRTNNKTVRNS